MPKSFSSPATFPPRSNYDIPFPDHSTASLQLCLPSLLRPPTTRRINPTRSRQSRQSHLLSREYFPFACLHEFPPPKNPLLCIRSISALPFPREIEISCRLLPILIPIFISIPKLA